MVAPGLDFRILAGRGWLTPAEWAQRELTRERQEEEPKR